MERPSLAEGRPTVRLPPNLQILCNRHSSTKPTECGDPTTTYSLNRAILAALSDCPNLGCQPEYYKQPRTSNDSVVGRQGILAGLVAVSY
eukprot:1022980-Prorocentrum_minimum.AAC.1